MPARGSAVKKHSMYVRKGWFFWQATFSKRPLGAPYRSRTRQGAIDKALKRAFPSGERKWQRVEVTIDEDALTP